MEKQLFAALTACMLAAAPACEKIDSAGTAEEAADSLITIILPVRERVQGSTDVFLYSDSGVRRLEGHVRLSGGNDSAKFKTPAGDKLAVVIANSPKIFNDLALTSFDSMEILPFHYCDELPGAPMMSGSSSCRAGDTLGISMTSVMCSVSLMSVEHSFEGYRRLEDPVVWLENVNSSVEVLRRDAFLPAETTSDTTGMRGLMWEKLPYDVGMYTQYPGITLHCYPNQSSMAKSRIVVEGKVDGSACRFSADLPLMPAGSILSAELKISSQPEKYTFSVF